MSRTFPISCKSENRLGAFRLLSYQYKVKYKEKVYTFHFEPGITLPISNFEVNTIIVLLEILELEMINFRLSARKGNMYLNHCFTLHVCVSTWMFMYVTLQCFITLTAPATARMYFEGFSFHYDMILKKWCTYLQQVVQLAPVLI